MNQKTRKAFIRFLDSLGYHLEPSEPLSEAIEELLIALQKDYMNEAEKK